MKLAANITVFSNALQERDGWHLDEDLHLSLFIFFLILLVLLSPERIHHKHHNNTPQNLGGKKPIISQVQQQENHRERNTEAAVRSMRIKHL